MTARRRGNGEGTILKRKDGRWAAAIVQDDGTRKWIYAKTRREVAARLTKIQRDIAEGLPTLGRVRLAKLTPHHVHSLIVDKTREGRLAPRTIQYMHSVLRAALNQALRWRMVHYNAASMVSAPRATRLEPKVLTPEEARRLLGVLRGNRLEALYSVALALGLRQGEALGLKWSDLDLDAGILHVRRAAQRIPHQGTQLVETKTAGSRRTLFLPPVVVSALRAHRGRQTLERLAAGPARADLDLVFPSRRGTLADGPNITHRFRRLLMRAGLPPMRFHDLRHACASLLLVQGVHPRVVMETLGHSQISLTMNTYSHVLPALQREAAERMEAILTHRD